MTRTYIKNLKEKVSSEVKISGWVDVRRDHGKLIFIDLRDVTGKVQMVVLPASLAGGLNHKEVHELAQKIRPEWVIEVIGKVNNRPEKLINKNEPLGAIEVEVLELKVLGQAKELPFELGGEINIDTHLDFLPLTLRDKKHRAIFKVQAEIVKAFRDFYTNEGFVEFQAPKLIGDDAEGGANSFDVTYFKHTAHLAQSPQLYKQIMVGVFERVFTVGNVYRAEKHSTTRHLNEYTSLDIEMGFINDHHDVMNIENKFFVYLEKELQKNCPREFTYLKAEIPKVPKEMPKMTLREAQKLITKETGKDCTKEPDLEPEHERWLCEYSKKKFGSDFIFITNFPTAKRPFYTYRDEKDPTYTKGFDLLFRGVEITTGAQRIHDYDALVCSLKDKKLDSERFIYYLQAFKYGMPPHGGFGMGLERLTAKLLGIENVKEATLFPRDLNRIDLLLSK
ncbi:MAG: nondiscriminating aspartyl-tRNA synthetase [Parcubacteria group bacterium Gr01-1014_73]|nr:MAG: nondiscriminating aspartyl-tRNA synthetase [Parcubacteria group bacterium Gr01-1014_73]